MTRASEVAGPLLDQEFDHQEAVSTLHDVDSVAKVGERPSCFREVLADPKHQDPSSHLVISRETLLPDTDSPCSFLPSHQKVRALMALFY